MAQNADGDMSLVAPFLTDDPQFCLGVEYGQWYERIKPMDGKLVGKIHLLVHRANQDRFLVLASRLGYVVKRQRTHDETWMAITLVSS
jgi:hypothetical protein